MKKTIKGLAVTLILMFGLAFVAACSDEGAGDLPPPPPTDWTLKRFGSFDEMLTFSGKALSTKSKEDLVKDIDAKISDLDCNNYYYGGSGGGSGNLLADPTPANATSDSGGSTAVTFTATNTQESNVDEADIVKTNGSHAFVIHGSELKIVKVWPTSEFKEEGKIELEGTPDSLYLKQEMAVVFSKLNSGTSAYTIVSFINVREPSAPKIVRTSYYPGELVSTRRIDGKIYIVNQPTFRPEGPAYDYNLARFVPNCSAVQKKPVSLTDARAKLKEENIRNIDNWLGSNGLPVIRHKIGDAPERVVVPEYFKFSRSEAAKSSSLIGLIKIDMGDLDGMDAYEYVMGSTKTVYASTESIYVASESSNYGKVAIHRFILDVDRDGIDYFGTAAIDGSLLNQFSLSEYEGYLRVVTAGVSRTEGDFGGTSEAVVSVVDAMDQAMPVVGKVAGIGKNEDIKAVRFIGTKGYVVTFKKIDPLFVVELENPLEPKLAGELKVPGFSTYLHPFDDGHLIGVGKDADDQGAFAWFQGLKLSMFDVTDSANPAEDANLVIGSRGTMSPAVDDHKAFTFDAGKRLLALPISLCETDKKGYSGSQKGKFAYDGVQIYEVSADGGFKLAGEVKVFTDTNDGKGYYNNKCNGWSYTGDVQRAVLIGYDKTTSVIVITKNGLKLSSMDGSGMVGVDWAAITDDTNDLGFLGSNFILSN